MFLRSHKGETWSAFKRRVIRAEQAALDELALVSSAMRAPTSRQPRGGRAMRTAPRAADAAAKKITPWAGGLPEQHLLVSRISARTHLSASVQPLLFERER
jgi:hypothetical protein